MESATNPPTILLVVGVLCIFLGVFGGGFQIKELSIPKFSIPSRAMGAVVGLVLIILSRFWGFDFSQDDKTGDAMANTADPGVTVKQVEPEEPKVPIEPVQIAGGIAGTIDELKPLWENLDITDNDLLKEYLEIQNDDDFEDLSLIYKSEVNNKIVTLNESMKVVAETDKYLADELITLSSKVNHLGTFFDEDVENLRLSRKVKDRLADEKADLETELKNSAKIASTNDFLMCKEVVNKNCVQSSQKFKSSKIWAWAKIESPNDTEVTLKWVNLDSNDEVNSRRYTIQKSSGYRVSGAKSLDTSGNYEVRLYNQKSKLIAKKQFEVR